MLSTEAEGRGGEHLVPAVVLTLETSEMPFFFFTTKATQPRPQVFSVNGALTCRELHF